MKTIGALIILAAILAAYHIHGWRGAIPAGEDESPHQMRLLGNRCTAPESVDRHLLQQSWFHDQQFTQLAGAFGQASFSLSPPGQAAGFIEGAYCITGNSLEVRYYEREFVPVGVNLSRQSVSFGARLNPKGSDSFVVRELTKDRMVLAFSSDGEDHAFYRKH